jgi:hypothetical protein
VVYRPDLLRVGGDWLQEVYFEFQFDDDGVRPDIGLVVQRLRGLCPDVEIGAWLVRPSPALGRSSPLRYLNAGGDVERVIAAAAEEDWPAASSPTVETGIDRSRTETEAPSIVPTRHHRRWGRTPPRVVGSH